MNRWLLFIFFFLSGFSALIYELTWARKLSLVFGTDAYAIATILAVFFAGLALGSWLFGKLADNTSAGVNLTHPEGVKLSVKLNLHPLFIYGILEVGIGLYALATPWIFQVIESLQIIFWRAFEPTFSGFNLFSLILSLIALIVPTVLMGGTLPVIAKAIMRIQTNPPGGGERMGTNAQVGSTVGWLYAVNTVGAVVGTAIAGFVLIAALGVNETIWVAGGVSVVVGLAALYLSTREYQGKVRNSQEKVVQRSPVHSSLSSVLILYAFFFSGFAAIALEVLWTRLFVMVVGGSTYAFTLVLLAFLIGIALGSALVSPFIARIRNPILWFALIELVLGASVILFIPLFGQLPFWFLSIYQNFGSNFLGLQFGLWLLGLVIMLIPTLLMGMAFPIAIKAASQTLDKKFTIVNKLSNPDSGEHRVGGVVGGMYAANTVGGVLGALGAGFVLLPLLGTQRGIFLSALLYLLIGLVLFLVANTPRWSKSLILLIVLVSILIGGRIPEWNRAVFTAGFYVDPSASSGQVHEEILRNLKRTKLLYEAEGISANVAVRQAKDGTLSLRINGKTDASTGADMENQLLLGHLPLLLHPQQPKEVLVVGMGSGITLGSVLSHDDVAHADALEIEEKVVEAAAYFSKYANNALNDPRVRLIVGDGRKYLLSNSKLLITNDELRVAKYDVITSEPSNPWLSGSSKLFTKEYFELLRGALNEEGVVLQWINLYAIDMEGLKRVVAAFQETFPYTLAFGMPASNDVALIGSTKPLSFDYMKLSNSLGEERVKADLAKVGMSEPFELLAYFALDSKGVKKFVGTTPANTDDHPYVEFSAPKYLYQPTPVNPWKVIYENLSPVKDVVYNTSEVGGAFTSEVESTEEFRQARLLTHIYSIEKNIGEGIKEAEKALKLDPNNSFIRETLAKFYFEEGTSFFNQSEYGKAITSLKKSLQFKKTAEAYFNLGQTYGWDGNMEAAREQYEAAVAFDPEFIEGWRWLGEVDQELGDLNRALEAYEKVVELEARDKEALTSLGRLYILRRDFGRAREYLEKALRIDPKFKEARELLRQLP